MDHRYIQEHNVIDRYLMDRLADDELPDFEAHFVDCPQCRDLLDETRDFRDALRRSAVVELDGRATDSPASKPAGYRFLAMAAMLCIAVLGTFAGSYLLSIRPLQNRLQELSQPQTDVPQFLLSQSRGEALPMEIRLDQGSSRVTLSLEIDGDPLIESYSVRLLSGQDSVWSGDGLHLNVLDLLSITFPASLLTPGEYRLEVTGSASDGRSVRVGVFPFRANRR